VIFSQNRDELRKMYASAWQKVCNNQSMSPLEAQIARVIQEHPEYHQVVGGDLEQEFTVEKGDTNPFLHMGLHLGIREQIATNRPAGIATVFENLTRRLGDTHASEHRMIDCLAETLWQAQRDNSAPDERLYLQQLQKL
jgi:hypothetical protein